MKKKIIAMFTVITLFLSLISMNVIAATPLMTGTLSKGNLTITVTGLDSKVEQVEFLATSKTDVTDYWLDTDEVSNQTATMTFKVPSNDYTVNATTLYSNSSGINETQLNPIEVTQSTAKPTSTSIGVTYAAYVQKIGLQSAVSNGSLAGTTGKSLRIEGLKVNLTGTVPKGASVTYKAYVQSIGWQNAGSNGAMVGTTAKSLRIEALKITIKGMTGYAIKYRAYVQKIGWQSWQTTKNGTSVNSAAIAGTTGKSLRIEALQITI